jgi:hypothetical protein
MLPFRTNALIDTYKVAERMHRVWRSALEGNKILTDIAMIGTKLNAQVIIKNLQNMPAKSLPPTGARGRMEQEYQDWPACKAGDHTRADPKTA